MYDHDTYNYNNFVSLNNGYISLADRYKRTHYQISTSYDFDNLTLFNKNATLLIAFNVFDFLNETLTNHSMSTRTTSFISISNFEYSMARSDSQSFILSIPEELNHNLVVSPGQEFTFSLT